VVGSSDDPLVSRLRGFQAAAKRLARKGDLVDAHFALYALWPVLVGALRRKPLVVHFQGPWAEESLSASDPGRLVFAGKHVIERLVYRRANELVVLSAAFKRVLVERYGVAPWRVRVLPPGVELDQFLPGDRDRARAALGVEPERWVALTVRRLVPRMGLDVLIEAWAKVAMASGDALLLVAGNGPCRSELEAQVDQLGITKNVRFLGRVSDDDLVACYRAADTCVVPTVALEGFGLVVLEALACGTPVIATDEGGLPEALDGLDISLVVPARDPSALAGRLQAARDGTLPLPSRERCRRYAEGFSWTQVAERTIDAYRRAAGPPARRDLRVVYLDHCARLSGGELALLRMLPALVGVDAHVILGEDGPLAARLARGGISVEVLPIADDVRDLRRDLAVATRLPVASAVRAAAYTGRLAARLRKLRPDLVHTNSLKAALYGGIAARLAGIPVIWHLRDRIAPDYLPDRAVRLVRALARRLPAAVIANSHTTLATLGLASVTSAPISAVCPSPVSMPKQPTRNVDRLQIGMVGRLAPWKGQDVFLRAFTAAFPAGAEQAVVVGEAMFGEQSYAHALRELANELGIGQRVEFTGFREDIPEVLARLDVLVHASTIPEPFGQVVVEGMAAGLPVVASDGGGPAEIITDAVDGVLSPPGDIEELAAALRRLADDPALRVRLGRQARIRARAFAPETIAAQVVELYHKVLAVPGGAE
jgi:glycosyltransferase involved in cell wall biosynthesis